jgi:hypothetical protein
MSMCGVNSAVPNHTWVDLPNYAEESITEVLATPPHPPPKYCRPSELGSYSVSCLSELPTGVTAGGLQENSAHGLFVGAGSSPLRPPRSHTRRSHKGSVADPCHLVRIRWDPYLSLTDLDPAPAIFGRDGQDGNQKFFST